MLNWHLCPVGNLGFCKPYLLVITNFPTLYLGWASAQWGPHPQDWGHWPIWHGKWAGGSGTEFCIELTTDNETCLRLLDIRHWDLTESWQKLLNFIIQVLRQCGNRVKLVITRGPPEETAIVPMVLPTVTEQQVRQDNRVGGWVGGGEGWRWGGFIRFVSLKGYIY